MQGAEQACLNLCCTIPGQLAAALKAAGRREGCCLPCRRREAQDWARKLVSSAALPTCERDRLKQAYLEWQSVRVGPSLLAPAHT